MRASVVIPLWNGAEVIGDCLQALYYSASDCLDEVICVDNASADGSAELVAERFPAVRLLRQPVNLGFAGGVNVGMAAAAGDSFVLLNQDCLVEPHTLEILLAALEAEGKGGIAGCTLLNPDGTINHAGAEVTRPLAAGRHRVERASTQPQVVDYVTGAVFALTRTVWDTAGPLDEGFYPAYYEESDYCYRARRHGFPVIYVPDAQARHLFSSRAWQTDPVRHAAMQHRSRYRFIVKHFNAAETEAFFAAESANLVVEPYFEQAVARTLASRDILHGLPEILARRTADLGQPASAVEAQRLRAGFGGLMSAAFGRARALLRAPVDADDDAHGASLLDEERRLSAHLADLRREEHRLLERIYFRAPELAGVPEPTLTRFWRLFVKRPFSVLIGRDYRLQTYLSALHAVRLDQVEALDTCRFYRSEHRLNRLERDLRRKLTELADEVRLLTLLAEYDQR